MDKKQKTSPSSKQKNTHNIAVYGSLRKGFGNHRLIEHSKFKGEFKMFVPYTMVSLGGFPGLIRNREETMNDDAYIAFEIYEVDEETYRRVEMLEGYPSFYQKDVLKFAMNGKIETAEYYVLNESRDHSYAHYDIVESGDWEEYKKARQRDYKQSYF